MSVGALSVPHPRQNESTLRVFGVTHGRRVPLWRPGLAASRAAHIHWSQFHLVRLTDGYEHSTEIVVPLTLIFHRG
jgi:hypothetical protein